MEKLEPLRFGGVNYNVADDEKFKFALTMLRDSLHDKGATLYIADNVITWNRTFSFLRDPFFVDIVNGNKATKFEKGAIWRLYILLYFAELASKAEGDYLELGCHTGYTASNVVKKIDFPGLGKQYYLYDLFEWNEGDEHTLLPGHKNETMYLDVKARFSDLPFVRIIKGPVPQSLSEGFPDKIAFAHIDMNHPIPEAGALERVLPRLSRGGVVIFDDYGWFGYQAQKLALDPIIKSHGLNVLELPTGQALLMKM